MKTCFKIKNSSIPVQLDMQANKWMYLSIFILMFFRIHIDTISIELSIMYFKVLVLLLTCFILNRILVSRQ